MPSMVIVALGAPGVPLICCAIVPDERLAPKRMPDASAVATLFIPLLLEIGRIDTRCPLLAIARSGPSSDAQDHKKEMLGRSVG